MPKLLTIVQQKLIDFMSTIRLDEFQTNNFVKLTRIFSIVANFRESSGPVC